jgi:hypothetical protein
MVAVCLTAQLTSGCGAISGVGGEEDGGFRVNVQLFGTKQAFEGVAVRINGHPPHATDVVGNGDIQARFVLCTNNKKKFLEASLGIVVDRADGRRVETKVELIACRFSSQPHRTKEHVTLWLEPDGRVAADFDTDKRVSASCTGIPQDRCSIETL